MAKLIVCNMISLDGYCAGPDGDPTVLPMDGAFDAYNATRLRAADVLLLGRVSFEMFRGFWPPVADDLKATPAQRQISRLNGAIDKVVISNSLELKQTGPWQNTRVIRRRDAHEQLAELKQKRGKDILIFGSHILWNDLLAHDLVDELHLMIGKVIVGKGTPAFEGPPPVSLTLIDVRKMAKSDNVLVRYEAHSPKKKKR